VDDHGGNDENNPNEGGVNRAKVVNEETCVNRAGVVIEEHVSTGKRWLMMFLGIRYLMIP
jgi:hypothetical protein